MTYGQVVTLVAVCRMYTGFLQHFFKFKNMFKKKEDRNVFKVNLGHGIETLTYYELHARFLCLTEEEQKYLNENIRHCIFE